MASEAAAFGSPPNAQLQVYSGLRALSFTQSCGVRKSRNKIQGPWRLSHALCERVM